MAANRVAVLEGGELVALGRPWEVMEGESLSEMFERPISVTEHPARGTPLVVPLPRVEIEGREVPSVGGEAASPTDAKRRRQKR